MSDMAGDALYLSSGCVFHHSNATLWYPLFVPLKILHYLHTGYWLHPPIFGLWTATKSLQLASWWILTAYS